jgi:hypothetical protein
MARGENVRRGRWLRLFASGVVVSGIAAASGVWASSPPASAALLTCSSTTPISYGAGAITGSITNPTEAACFTFPVAAGDNVRFNVRAVSGAVTPFTDVFNAADVSKCATPGDIECAADSTGTWTVQISDEFQTHTGTFNIFAQRLDRPVGCRSITFGSAPLTGDIAAIADAACFTFSGNAGDVIYGHDVDLAGSGAPFMEVEAPDGTQVCFVETGAFDCTLTKTGTQTILAYNQASQTGKFNIDVQRLTDPAKCSALKFGAAPLTKRITAKGAIDCFTYSGPTGALVTVDPVVISGTLSPETDIFTPTGTSACATSGELPDCEITAAGKWVTLVWDTSGIHTGKFTIAAVDLNLSVLSGPPGTAVSVSSGGFKSGETVDVNYKTGLTSPKTVSICNATATTSGNLTCSGTIPTTDAGALGRHVVEAVGSSSGDTTSGTFTLT